MKNGQPKKALLSRQATRVSNQYSPDQSEHTEDEKNHNDSDTITNVIDFRAGRSQLNSSNILNLQRVIGNKAVQRLIETRNQTSPVQKTGTANQIQRKIFMSINSFNDKVDGTDINNAKDIKSIRRTLQAYNKIANDPKALSARLKTLKRLDEKLYAWLTNRPSKDLSTVSNSAFIQDLLKKSNNEHETIVEEIRKQSDILPIDTSKMDSEEIKQVKNLWQSMIAGEGNIKVIGNKKFEKRTYSQLAKILQTPTGRDLLQYLDATQKTGEGRDDRILILEKLTEEYAHIEEGRTSESSYAMSLNTFKPDPIPNTQSNPENPVEDEKQSHMMGFGTNMTGADDEDEYQPMNNPKDLNQAILSGAKGITSGGQKHKFGEGSGAIVKITDNDDEVKTEKMSGEVNNEVIDPAFVTLAHELGHAFKMRAGALADNGSLSTPFEQNLEPNTDEQMLWSKKPEEFLNIQGVENPVREEVGMQRRKYHKPLGSVISYKRFVELRNLLFGVSNRDKVVAMEFPSFTQLNSLLNTSKNNLGDDNVYNPIKVQVQNLTNLISDDAIREAKRTIINRSVATIKDTAGEEDFNKYVTRSPEYRKLIRYIANNLPSLTVPGANLDPVKDKIRNLRTDLPTIISREKKSYKKERRQQKWKNFKEALSF